MAGPAIQWRTTRSSLKIGDACAFAFAINQQDGRSLGALGEVVTARITHQNYRSYVAP